MGEAQKYVIVSSSANMAAHRIHLEKIDGSEETAAAILKAWRKHLKGTLEES
jgi:hypothetical protein